MKMMIMNKKILIGLLIIFAVLCFFGGIEEIKTSLLDELSYYKNIAYSPLFCSIMTGIEIILLLKKKSISSRVVGLLINVVKFIAPIHIERLLFRVNEVMGGLNRTNFEYSTLGYVIILIGILISVIYIVDIGIGIGLKENGNEANSQ